MHSMRNIISGKTLFDPLTAASAIVILLVILYWPVVSFQYINYDDPNWIYNNPHIAGGLSLASLCWAVTGVVNSTWCPLTNLSFILECQFFGVNPATSHLINFLLHTANVLLLFRFLSRIFGWTPPAAGITLLFAVHPMNVEAVAWISDRKGLLSALFLLLMLTKYFDYAKKASTKSYWQAVAFYGLSLASKPTAITVPLMLILLDVWPLARSDGRGKSRGQRALEKVPFFVLAGSDAIIAYKGQHDTAGIASHPFLINVQTAIIGCARYIANLAWPMDLNVCYFHPGSWPWSLVLASAVLVTLCVATLGLWWRQDKKPLICFALFVLGLAPVLELIPAGHCYMADRYTYLPYIWLMMVLAPPLCEIARKFPVILIPTGLATSLLIWDTSQQLACWKNSRTVFERALAVNPRNPVALVNLAAACSTQNDAGNAISHIDAAVNLDGENPFVQLTAAQIYQQAGQYKAAYQHFKKACELCKSPLYLSSFAGFISTHPGLARPEEGLNAARLAMLIAPSAEAFDLYAITLALNRAFAPAIRCEREALVLEGANRLYKSHLAMFQSKKFLTTE